MPVFELESSMTPSKFINVDVNDSGSGRKSQVVAINRFESGRKNSTKSHGNEFMLNLNRCEDAIPSSLANKSQSCTDLTRTYKVLSEQLFGKEKELAIKTTTNLGTVGDQIEWFMLAVSSYKMKKYGECLFSVSKTQKSQNLNLN